MQVNQVYQIVNGATEQVTGRSDLLNEDLSNVVDTGNEIFNLDNAYNKICNALIDHIGRMVFVNRPYSGAAPSLLRDGWEYGSIMEKIASDLPEATVNESWELEDGASYDPFVFKGTTVDVKFFNKRVTFELDKSIVDRQLRSAFTSATQLNAFISMLFNEVDKSMTIKNDALTMRTINNFIAETLYADYGSAAYSSKSGIKAVNLLYMYNQKFSKNLTAANAVTDPDFLRFASYQMGLYQDRMRRMSTLFNVGGKNRFTPSDMLHIVYLSEFEKAAGVYLYDAANQFNSEELKFPTAEVVPFWQGSGTDYAFGNTSKIYVTTEGGHSVQATGIIAIMFDRDAMGIMNENSRVETQRNPKAEFTNYFYKRDAQYFNDLNENFVVFFVA